MITWSDVCTVLLGWLTSLSLLLLLLGWIALLSSSLYGRHNYIDWNHSRKLYRNNKETNRRVNQAVICDPKRDCNGKPLGQTNTLCTHARDWLPSWNWCAKTTLQKEYNDFFSLDRERRSVSVALELTNPQDLPQEATPKTTTGRSSLVCEWWGKRRGRLANRIVFVFEPLSLSVRISTGRNAVNFHLRSTDTSLQTTLLFSPLLIRVFSTCVVSCRLFFGLRESRILKMDEVMGEERGGNSG